MTETFDNWRERHIRDGFRVDKVAWMRWGDDAFSRWLAIRRDPSGVIHKSEYVRGAE